MNDAGRARYPQIGRADLAEGDEEPLFQSLADASLWTLWTYGYNLTSGFGMQASDWAGEERRTSSGTFRYWYEVGWSGDGSKRDSLDDEREGVDPQMSDQNRRARTTGDPLELFFDPVFAAAAWDTVGPWPRSCR
jgi:hypothetical protein